MNYTYEAILFFSNVWNLQLWESELTVITELNTLLLFFLIHHEYLRGHLICFSERSGAYRMQLQFPQITAAVHFSCFACYIPSWFKGMKHIRSLKSNSSKLWVFLIMRKQNMKCNLKKSICSTYFKHVLDYS